MSWFFGKKKTSPSTPPEPSTTAANMPNSDGDDFIFVERKGSQKPNLDDSGPGPMSNHPLYPPLLPYSLGQTAPVLPSSHSQEHHLNRQDSIAAGPHMLKGIPFKISPKLDSDSSDNLRQYTECANDVLFQISQINLEACSYDFEVENSVLLEVGLGVENFD